MPLHIISSHPQNRLDEDLEKLGLRDDFNSIQGHCHDKSEFISDLVSDSGLRGDNVVYVGDTVSDVSAAKRAGVIPIAVSYGYQPRSKLEKCNPNHLVDSVLELSSLLIKQ